MTNFVIFFIGGVIVVALLSAGTAFLALKITKRKRLSILFGGLALPALFVIELVYWLQTMSVNDAAPGAVIAGTFVAVSLSTPIGLIASALVTRMMSVET